MVKCLKRPWRDILSIKFNCVFPEYYSKQTQTDYCKLFIISYIHSNMQNPGIEWVKIHSVL